MNSNRVLVLVLGGAALAIAVALVLHRAPASAGITPSTLASESKSSHASPTANRPSTELTDVEITPTARDPVAPSASAPTTATPDPVVTPEETWAKKYAGLTSAQLWQRRVELNNKIGELAQPDLQKMFDSGQYEVLHGGTESKGNEDWKPDIVMSLQSTPAIPGGAPAEWRRAILPESTFPELYEMRREERWLDKHTSEVQRAEAEAKSSAQGK
jgi:hypothetical protein